MDLRQLREANRARQREWPGNEHADLAFRAIEVAGEAGELCEKVKKLLRAERGIAGTTATPSDVSEEMADLLISLDLLADALGVSLAAAVRAKFNATSVKYELRTRIGEAGDTKQARVGATEEASMSWWFSYDGETWHEAASRDEAINGLDGQGGHVGQGEQREVRLSDFVDVDGLIVAATDAADSDPEIATEDAWSFDVTDEQAEDLQRALREAVDAWQHRHGRSWRADVITFAGEPEQITAAGT